MQMQGSATIVLAALLFRRLAEALLGDVTKVQKTAHADNNKKLSRLHINTGTISVSSQLRSGLGYTQYGT